MPHEADYEWLAVGLANHLLASKWNRPKLIETASLFLRREKRDGVGKLIDDILDRQLQSYPPQEHDLADLILNSRHYRREAIYIAKDWADRGLEFYPPAFNPSPKFRGLRVPELTTQGDLAAWLGLSIGEFDWFTDDKRLAGQTLIPDLQHYWYHFVPKRSGAPRLVEAPKPRLKTMQRRVLSDILSQMPAHPAAHGFVAGRSCLSAAQVHASEAVVISLDLQNFFVSTPLRRVHGIFRSLGYPHLTARALTGLVSTATPDRVFNRPDAGGAHAVHVRRDHAARHLPQGAPTSPALANLAARQLDVRLTGLVDAFAARYTRYADDLTFSGDAAFARRSGPFIRLVEEIVEDAGYRLNASKTRVLPRSMQQRVTGAVVNDHVNVARKDYDRLKAILHNCIRNGPHDQNRDGVADFRAHLDGRVMWVEQVNPQRGAKLRMLFNGISWPE
ncbi:MAG: reverse transcriptase family protein [Pseudomonadota bacterium]